jgi:hypothetical protein
MSFARKQAFLRICALVCMTIAAPAVQSQNSCKGQQCATVHVDGVSKDFPGNVIAGQLEPDANRRNVRVSDLKRTYQLTCNIENKDCTLPPVGSRWQFVTKQRDKPEYLGDRQGEFPHQGIEVFLKSTARTFGPYWLVSEMSLIDNYSFQRLVSECKSKEHGLNENDCTKWIARKAKLIEEECPTADGQEACHSFRGLLSADDPDILDLIARLEHTYVCFRPSEDTFFTVWFSEPVEWNWLKPSEEDQKALKLSPFSLMQFGSLGVDYYKQGVHEKKLSLSGVSIWSYVPLGADFTPSALAHLATSSDAKLERSDAQPTIEVDGTRIAVSEEYKNNKDEEIRHTLLIQRSTGRFTETYEESSSQRTILDYSGRCLIAPNTGNE